MQSRSSAQTGSSIAAFGDVGYLARQLLRFSVATFAVICAVMIVWWSLTPEAALDRRSATARAREDLQTFHNSQSINARDTRSSPLDALSRSLDQMGSRISDGFSRMWGGDRREMAIREQGLRGYFNGPPQTQRLQADAPTGRPLVRGLTAEEIAAVQNHDRAAAAVQPMLPVEAEAQPEHPAPAKGKPADPKARSASALRGTIAPPAPVRTSAVVGERNEFNAVNNALAAAENDYRAFPQALGEVQSFLERYPSSTRRPQFASRLEALSGIRNRAEEERSRIEPDSILAPVDFTDSELEKAAACLGALPQIRAVAMVTKSVIVQRHIPAYVVMADADYARAAPGSVTPAARASLADAVTKCFPRPHAAGSLRVIFWPEGDAVTAAPLMAKIEGALIYAR